MDLTLIHRGYMYGTNTEVRVLYHARAPVRGGRARVGACGAAG